MTFLFYEGNGNYGITETKLSDILLRTSPEDIVDCITEIGVKINRYFQTISKNIDYILWLDMVTGKVYLKAYIKINGMIAEQETIEEDVEEFKISEEEINTFISFILI